MVDYLLIKLVQVFLLQIFQQLGALLVVQGLGECNIAILMLLLEILDIFSKLASFDTIDYERIL